MEPQDSKYLETFLAYIRNSKGYRPKFGRGSYEAGVSLAEFKSLYGSDPFYSWIGLDSDLIYAAHCAAGGMTSIYRQIGIGCERLFRDILIDSTGYTTPESAAWSYTTQTRSGQSKTLSLDGRLELAEIRNREVLTNVELWIKEYCADLSQVSQPSNGVVFEIRQGYKSKDSKRQHADIDNATVAWANSYLPVFAAFSSQIDTDIILRYRNDRCGILIGVTNENNKESLYAFCKQILGYDLAGFFKHHTEIIRTEINDVLEQLLSAE